MTCENCGFKYAHVMKFTSEGCWCNKCGEVRSSGMPDVYFNQPYLDPNLPHPKRPWEKDGVWVTSKRHKQQLMKEQGLVEAGDKRHGYRLYDKNQVRREAERFGIRT